MTAAMNEAWIRWLLENCDLVRGIFLVLEMGTFLLLGGIPLPSTGFPPNGMFAWRVGQPICMDHVVSGTSKAEVGGTFLVRWGI